MTIPRLRALIVLVHGLFGFAQLRIGPWVLADYFHGIPPALAKTGNRAFVARLSPTNGIAARAAQGRLGQFPDVPGHDRRNDGSGGLGCRSVIRGDCGT